MFKGNNVLELNEATMIAAVQDYLNAKMVEAGSLKVTGIKAETKMGNQLHFQVSTEEANPLVD